MMNAGKWGPGCTTRFAIGIWIVSQLTGAFFGRMEDRRMRCTTKRFNSNLRYRRRAEIGLAKSYSAAQHP